LAPAVEHLVDQLGWVLEVGVDHHDDVAAGVVEPGGDRRLVAEVAGEGDDPDPRVLPREPLQQLRRAVGGAVVDEDQLEGKALERGNHAAVELVERLDFVEDGRGNAQQPERPPLLTGAARRRR
jgi:hypothetical protein